MAVRKNITETISTKMSRKNTNMKKKIIKSYKPLILIKLEVIAMVIAIIIYTFITLKEINKNKNV